MCQAEFPLFKGKLIPERDSICHSIIEASYNRIITFEFKGDTINITENIVEK